MNFFLKLSLLNIILFILLSALITFALSYHHSSLFKLDIANINNNLIQESNFISKATPAKLSILKNKYQLKSLNFENKNTPKKISLSPAKDVNFLAPLFLSDFNREQQIINANGIIYYRINTDIGFNQFKDQMLFSIGFLFGIFVLFLCVQLFSVKNLQRCLIKEINTNDLKQNGFGLVSKHITKQKTDFYQQIKQQQLEINDLLKRLELDQLTGLLNRSAFNKNLSSLINPKEHSISTLVIIRSTALNEINRLKGHHVGDNYLQKVATILQNCCKSFTKIKLHRICGGDFAILAKDMDSTIANKLALEIHNQFNTYQELHEIACVGYVGFTTFTGGEQPEKIMSRADLALAKAQTQSSNSWEFQEADSNNEADEQGEQHWKNVILHIIASKQVKLIEQNIQALSSKMVSYRELFSHFSNEEGTKLPSETIFIMAQRLDLSVELEKMTIQTIFEQIKPKDDRRKHWGINISSTSLQSNHFIHWLDDLLKNNPQTSSFIIFEMDESVLDKNIVASQRIFAMLRKHHSRSCISKFGRGIASFKLFKSLNPNLVKVDANIIKNIETDRSNQQFARMLIDVAHRMGSLVIAEAVEEYDQRQILETMNFDALQGYFISKPTDFIND